VRASDEHGRVNGRDGALYGWIELVDGRNAAWYGWLWRFDGRDAAAACGKAAAKVMGYGEMVVVVYARLDVSR